jgi:hypothetical protein
MLQFLGMLSRLYFCLKLVQMLLSVCFYVDDIFIFCFVFVCDVNVNDFIFCFVFFNLYRPSLTLLTVCLTSKTIWLKPSCYIG